MRSLLQVAISKMAGAGNTFALVDATNSSAWVSVEKKLSISRAEFAKKICDQTVGIKADGLLFIQSGDQDYDYAWDFYNADGSSAEMCGNAVRCAARFCREAFSLGPEGDTRFLTGAGVVWAKVTEDQQVQVKMPMVKMLERKKTLEMPAGQKEEFTFLNTGVPHLVQRVSNMSQATMLKEMARQARKHKDLGPAGSNVTFYAESSLDAIEAVTFERGVEDFTLACGTGAVAAATVFASSKSLREVLVKMPGGPLRIKFNEAGNFPTMTGDAKFIGEFKVDLEVLNA